MRKAALSVVAVAMIGGLAAPSLASRGHDRDRHGHGRDGDVQPPPASSFQKVMLNDRPGEPMSLAVLPDGRVLHAARTGTIRIHNPRTGLNTVAAEVPIYRHDEEGLQGLAIDDNFAKNRWVYLYYSPPLNTPTDVAGTGINEGDAPTDLVTAEDRARLALFNGALRLSRYKLNGNTLDLTSEQQILDVPASRGICCHVGGQIDFDGKGNLYLSTGDDTNPFVSDGYTPIDERANRNPAFDAQRTSANTNDLRGKILRIRVNSDGSYDIPRGNLFRKGTPRTRPEIYAMGFRNPFRFAVNDENGNVYVGDYSPTRPWRTRCAGPRATGAGCWSSDRATTAGRTASRGPASRDPADTSTTTSRPARRARPSTAAGRSTTRPTTPASGACPRWCSPTSGTPTRRPTRRPVPRAARAARRRLRQRRRADGRPGVRLQQAQPVADEVAGAVRRPPAVLRVDARLREAVRAQPRERHAAEAHAQPVPGHRPRARS